MKAMLKVFLALALITVRANAYSLLGPFVDWMEQTNGYRQPYDIGGPMDLGEEYRWNVPVLTYAFDQSFLDYFGSNGVAAVEQAIQILNDVPPASILVLTNHPTDTGRMKYPAAAQGLQDLKSSTLESLVELLGLAEPTRNVFDLKQWSLLFLQFPTCLDQLCWQDWAIPDFIVERNFDPYTQAPSQWVNDVLMVGYIDCFSANSFFVNGSFCDVLEISADPLASRYTAVADRGGWYGSGHGPGFFYTGLTRDDVGGLRYLLQTNNCNLETLLPGVHGIGTNAGNFVNQALRPGVDKVTLVRPAYDPLLGQFSPPFTNQFTDTYLTNDSLVHQQLERVVTEPDFLFCVADTYDADGTEPWVKRPGTSNWWNSAAPILAGPGVIRPPIQFTFKRPNPKVYTDDSHPSGPAAVYYSRWGSFCDSTNAPIAYSGEWLQETNRLTVRFWLDNGSAPKTPVFSWILPVTVGRTTTLQAATNLTDWVSLGSVTNSGASLEWHHTRSLERRFFRVVPE